MSDFPKVTELSAAGAQVSVHLCATPPSTELYREHCHVAWLGRLVGWFLIDLLCREVYTFIFL